MALITKLDGMVLTVKTVKASNPTGKLKYLIDIENSPTFKMNKVCPLQKEDEFRLVKMQLQNCSVSIGIHGSSL